MNVAQERIGRYREHMKFREWLSNVTKDSQGEIAQRIDVSRRTLQNQIYQDTPQIKTIIKISESYGVSPITALIELGHVDPKWAIPSQADREAALRSATAEELAGEVTRRLRAAEASDENFPDPPYPLEERHHGIDPEIPS